MIEDPYAITLPNVRSLLIPDPGYVFLEADLARADAQVCAWDAGCAALKRAFQVNEDIHTDNAYWMYGDKIDPNALHINGQSFRQNMKVGVHATDYATGYKTLAASIAVPEPKAADFIRWWTRRRHPEIGEWHDEWSARIRGRRVIEVRNKFGFRRVYTDRTDHLLSQVLAWICQSTVSIVINKAMKAIDCAEDMFGRERCGHCVVCTAANDNDLQLLLQVHDSVLTQVRSEQLYTFAPRILSKFNIVVPYDDPLIIPAELKHSSAHWGAMQKLAA